MEIVDGDDFSGFLKNPKGKLAVNVRLANTSRILSVFKDENNNFKLFVSVLKIFLNDF